MSVPDSEHREVLKFITDNPTGLQRRVEHDKLGTMKKPKGFAEMCERVHGLVEVVLAIVTLCQEHQYGVIEVHVHEGAIRRHYVKTCFETPKT